MMKSLYFDAASTTYPRREALEAAFGAPWENPSAVNRFGVAVRRRIEDIRKNMLRALSSADRSLIFTSGGTEANNTALYDAFASAMSKVGKKVLLSGIDHSSVDECARRFAGQFGMEVSKMPIDRFGRILFENIDFSGVAVVCLTHVNNELGTINCPERLRDAVVRAQRSGKISNAPIVVTDGVQALGKIPLEDVRRGVRFSDYYTLSAHKVHGIKGVGALIAERRCLINPLHIGGSQESGQRAGTENVPGIMAMDAAFKALVANSGAESFERAKSAKELLLGEFTNRMSDGDFVINSPDDGSPYIVSVSLRGTKSEVMLHMLAESGISVSSASACSSAKNTVSRVIKMIGTPAEYADGTLRISFAPDYFWSDSEMAVSADDIRFLAESIAGAAAEVKKYNK